MSVWIAPHNWDNSLIERIEFDTISIRALSGSEQRISKEKIPHYTQEADHIASDRQILRNALMIIDRVPLQIYMGMWAWPLRLTSPITSTSGVASFSGILPHHWGGSVNGDFFVDKRGGAYQITSVGAGNTFNYIALNNGTVPVGECVYPAHLDTLRSVDAKALTDGAWRFRTTFSAGDAGGFAITTPLSDWPTLGGYVVFPFKLNWNTTPSIDYSYLAEVFRHFGGKYEIWRRCQSYESFSYSVLLRTQQEKNDFVKFCYYTRLGYNEFLMPHPATIELSGDIPTGSTIPTVDYYFSTYYFSGTYHGVMIERYGQPTLYYEVGNVSDNSITVVGVMPFIPRREIKNIRFLVKVREASPQVEINHLTSEVAEVKYRVMPQTSVVSITDRRCDNGAVTI